jgi:hypothetical protein
MNFIYTDHIKFQMFDRHISQGQIETTVNHPDRTEKDRQDPLLTVAIREFTPGTFLKVWYRLEKGQAAIVSCILVTVRRERPAPSSPAKTKKAKQRARKGKR